jgi:hemerythrin-like metal-binding protein
MLRAMKPLFRPAVLRCDWLASCPTGIDEIDADHRRLLRRLERMHGALQERRDAECRVRLDAFADALNAHFDFEESLLGGLDELRAMDHALDHDLLRVRAEVIRRAAAAETRPLALAGHIDAMAAILMSEIVGLDCDFRSPDVSPLTGLSAVT